MSFNKSKSGVTWIGEPLTQDQCNNELADLGVDLVEARTWNDTVAENTVASDSNSHKSAEEFRTALPKSIRPYDGLQVKGQGIHSSCFAAAMVGVAERQYFQKTKKARRFSIFPFYMLAQMQTPNLYGEDGGTVPPHGIKAAAKIGFLTEDTARRLLPPDIIAKWKGDVYPRGYWNGRGKFEQTAQRAYTEACRAYEPLLKMDEVRREMFENRLQTIIPAKTTCQTIEAEQSQTGTAVECHVWTPDCDSHPDQIQTFSGESRGGQHGHHATYIAGLGNGPIKANSWREFELLMEAIQRGEELGAKEWGDDGLKTWQIQAHNDMQRHHQTINYICSNMTVSSKPEQRVADLDDHTKWM